MSTSSKRQKTLEQRLAALEERLDRLELDLEDLWADDYESRDDAAIEEAPRAQA